MTEPLPEYWKRGDNHYKLITLASLISDNSPLYIMENQMTGMNDAIPFDDPKLEIDDA